MLTVVAHPAYILLGQGTFGGECAVAEMALCLLDVLFNAM